MDAYLPLNRNIDIKTKLAAKSKKGNHGQKGFDWFNIIQINGILVINKNIAADTKQFIS